MAFDTSMLARLALRTLEGDQSYVVNNETYLHVEPNGHVHAEFVPVSPYIEGLCRSMQCMIVSKESYETQKGHLASRAISSIHSSAILFKNHQGQISKSITRRSQRRSINLELSKSLDIINISPRRRRQEIPTKML